MKSSTKIILLVFFIILLFMMVLIVNRKEKNEISITVDYTEDNRGLGYSGQRKIAQDSGGNYFVTYRKKYQGKYQIFVTKIFRQKGGWKISGSDKPAASVNSMADQRVPSISIGKNNFIYVVWYGSDDKNGDQKNNRQIKFIKSGDFGASWSEVKNISIVDGFDNSEDYWQEHPYLLVGNDNNLYVVWEGKDKENRNQQIKFSRSSDGGETWTLWRNILSTKENTQSRPTMVQTSNGRLHLFSYSSSENPSDNQQIKYTWSDDGGDSWNPWVAISDAALDSRHSSAVEDGNYVHLVWRQINSEGKSQIVYKGLNGDNWKDSMVVSDSSSNQFFPSIAISKDKRIFVSWMENHDASGLPREDPQGGKIYAAVLDRNKFGNAVEISTEEGSLYPNMSAHADNLIPLVYESLGSNNKYDVIFKLLNM